MYDVITVGSATVDVFVKTDAEEVRVNHNHHYEKEIGFPVGAKLLIQEIDFQVGGGGTNTAVAFSRLGLKTAYLGKIGKDENGLKIFKLLKKEEIDYVGTLGEMSSYSVILDSKADDRTILTYKGSIDEMSYEEIHKEKLKTKWFYFCAMMNKSFVTLKKLAEYAEKNEIKIAFNPSLYLAKLGMKEIYPVLRHTNILVLNKEEAEALTGEEELIKGIKELKKIVKDVVIITDGKHGAWCYDGTYLYVAEPTKNLHIIETTGAGDAFASAFVAGKLMEKETDVCFRMAFLESESVIQNMGAKTGLQTKQKMMEHLKNDKRKITKTKI